MKKINLLKIEKRFLDKTFLDKQKKQLMNKNDKYCQKINIV